MSTLQVLCPNGRRQNVKTTPNTKLLQVLEEVCQKQKFMPPEDYKLVHGRNSLDLTLSVRFSNLANNAKLELVKSEKSRAESEVIIALQLENGERLQHGFSPGTTLWDILQHWENAPNSKVKGELTAVDGSQSPALHPVCIYMSEEACGETVLKSTQLRKLGLLGGRAVIRYVKRPVDDKVISEAAEKLAKEALQKQKREQAGVKRQASTSDVSVSQTSTQSSSFQDMGQSNSLEIQTEQSITGSLSGTTVNTDSGTRVLATTSNISADGKTELATISLNINVNIQNDNKPVVRDLDAVSDEPATKMVKTDQQPMDSSEPMEVELSDIADTVMETEDSVKETCQEPALSRPSQEEAAESIRNLNIPGLEVFTPQDFLDLPPDQQQVAQQLAATLLPKLLGRQVPGTMQPADNKPKPNKQRPLPPPANQFTDFKFPEETKGKQLYKNELSEYKKEDFQPCDRQTIVYSLLEKQEEDAEPRTVAVKTEDLPDDFFEVTDTDIKSLISAQKKKLDEMENQPLMTSAMRKAKLETMYSGYDRVVIRIQFTDKLVLQGFFRPRETVYAVQKFVKTNLKDKDIPFYLYTSPPKCVLKDESQTLIEAHLVPATIVYFGSTKQEEHFLSDSILSSIKTRLDADQLAAECLQSSESLQNEENQSALIGKGKQPASGSRAQYKTTKQTSNENSASSGGSRDVPKWFKIGKK